MLPEESLIKDRIKKLEELKKLGINPYPYSFDIKNHASEILTKYKDLGREEKTKDNVKIAGRLLTLREMGKASFGHIQDETGKIQFYAREDEVGKKEYGLLKKLDLGDILGIEGIIFRTKMGEISVWVEKLSLLCKSLRPLPEKWHGLKDIEARYRQRHLDLISNPEVREIFIKRTQIIKSIREFFDSRGFLEVEIPILQPIYGGAAARPFKTFLHDLKMDVYLRIALELYLKRIMVGGFEKIYEIGKQFRNESIDKTHNPEFTMIEFYEAYIDYEQVMKNTESLFEYVAKKIMGTTKIEYQGNKIDLKTPWTRITMIDSIKKYAKIDVTKEDNEGLKNILRNYNIELESDFSRGLAITLIFENLVEDKLIQPTFVIDHPIESTPLCKPKRDSKNKDLVERAELFINGWEMANLYSELNDPILQRKLLEEQAKQLRAGKEEANPMDEEFLRAIEVGLPPAGGCGIGIDRMIMLLTNSPTIRDVIFFPFMKTEGFKSEMPSESFKEVLPDINNLVNIYNSISIKHILPAGGDDLDKVDGNITLTIARGNEPFTLLGSGKKQSAEAGEVIYRDSKEVLCRRWNWRESDKTKMTENTKTVIVVLEGLKSTSKEQMEKALGDLKQNVIRYCGGKAKTTILDKNFKTIDLVRGKKLIIDDSIIKKFPEVKIGILVVKNLDNSGKDAINLLRETEKGIRSKIKDLEKEPKIKDWREAYSSFGTNPKEFKSSVEALLKRVL